jgi:hypothetical protein
MNEWSHMYIADSPGLTTFSLSFSFFAAGFFDFKTRNMMIAQWKETLDNLGIDFREELGIVESLSTAAQRLTWESEGLPGDQLSLENGVILDHNTRFPLVKSRPPAFWTRPLQRRWPVPFVLVRRFSLRMWKRLIQS